MVRGREPSGPHRALVSSMQDVLWTTPWLSRAE
jgi:hypothetical protein